MLSRAFLVLATGSALWAQAVTGASEPPAIPKLPFTAERMMQLARIGEPSLSPDGLQVAFTVQRANIDDNAISTHIYLVGATGGTPRQLTFEGDNNTNPQWSPDSRAIYFVSDRSGSSQVWSMDASGSNARQITDLSTEAGSILVTPDGARILFQSSVYPQCGADEACNFRQLDQEKQSKVKARIYTSLLYRHWNEWSSQRRPHLLVINTDGTGLVDLTPESYNIPRFSLGGVDDVDVSPDSLEVAFTMNVDEDAASSTNSDIYVVPVAGGEVRKITNGLGADATPRYSPDGRMLAFRSQEREGFESDRWRLMVLDRATGITNNLTASLDRWVGGYTWSPDSTRLFFTVEDRGRTGLQMIQATGGGSRNIIAGAVTLSDVQFSPDGRSMIYTETSGSSPAELYRATSTGGPATALTHLNDTLLSTFELTPLDELFAESTDEARIHSFLVKPPQFDDRRRYPVLFLIHGGPQGAWGETWSYRWNAQVFASAGYVVVMPNPRGSTGYGQAFLDAIRGDWGGQVYEDIMAVADRVAALPYVDPDRFVAAGGSFGGYMIDWMLGHTDRFKAFVSHAGVFDLRSMAAETEELWFVKWEFSGLPWDNPEMYARWSPSYFVNEFKTPTLVIHGEQDFRVPMGQGLQLFTALQSKAVPSKLLLFPDEGHWIQKPQNSLLWYTQVLGWLDEWVNKM